MIAQYRSQEIDRFAQNSLSAAAIEGAGAPRAEAAQVVQFARYSDAAIQQDRPGGLYRRVFKRGLDIALILASLPGWLPLIVLFALGNVLTGNAPFYSQPRLGKGGRVFRMWKLRSMVADADDALADLLARDTALRQEWETNQKLRMDPRITPLGRLLRKTSIDELPQLLNVLTGDMSLVGPRPMLPEQRALYPGEAYFRLRPGLTGLWQLSARNGSSFAARARYDADYEAEVTFSRDLRLILSTFSAVIRGTGV